VSRSNAELVNILSDLLDDKSDIWRRGSSLGVPTEFSLDQNYPNPFNAVTRIRFGLPVDSYVKIIVYDLMRREVIRLVDGQQTAGYHSVTWKGISSAGAHATSGVYFVRLEAGNFIKVNKMMLIR